MARKSKTKKEKPSGGERVRRKFIPWGSDRVKPDSPSSLEVLMTWLLTPGNAERWHREKPAGPCREIIQALEKSGIFHRELGDVQIKVRFIERNFMAATSHLSEKNQLDAFKRGEADQEVVNEVLRLCPRYRELAPVFGNVFMKKKKTTETSRVDVSGAMDGNKSPAGEWKKSLEKFRHIEQKTQAKSGGAKKAEKNKPGKRSANENGGDSAEVKESNAADAAGNAEEKSIVIAKKAAVNLDAGVAEEEKSNGVQDKDKDAEQGTTSTQSADVEEVQRDGEKGEKKEDEETDTTPGQEEAQGDAESDDSSVEETKSHARVAVKTGVRSPFKIMPKQSESEQSSSEEEGSDENEANSESESEQEEDVDGEGQIPLAQPNEVDATPTGERELTEEIEIDEENEPEADADKGDKSKAEESDETENEEEMEEELEQDISKAAADSSDDSNSSSSSESEHEGSDTEEEVPPTQLKAPSDHEQEAEEDESKNDIDMENDAEKSVEQSDSDVQKPVEESESEVESEGESPVLQPTTRKRSSSNESSTSRTTKRARRDSDFNDATRDLEREAFIERAKQERDQREELFQLERAKLECELQAKQVQLAMDRSLARKKLLGAGIDPTEVDRVLPL